MPEQDIDDSNAGTASSSRQAVRESFQDLKWVATSIGATSIVALLVALGYAIHLGGRGSALQLLWGLGLWSAAAALGFLFGIPKVLQGSQPPKPAPTGGTDGTTTAASTANTTSLPAYQQRVNTNLEEISDWLTKIIVGVTLVQLKSIPPMADSLARRVTAGLPGGPHEGFGLAIIVTLGTLGFLFGYLVTRLYIQGALARAERRIGQDESLEASPVHALLTQMTEAVGARSQEESAAAGGGPGTQASGALQRLADEYSGIDDPDWTIRTRRKEVAAAALTRAAVEHGVSREWLAAQKDEPMTLALAGLVQAAPRRGDATLLLTAAQHVQRKHVQYWILQALLRLLQLRLVSSDERKGIRRLLDQYEKTADASLLRSIEQVGARLDAAVS